MGKIEAVIFDMDGLLIDSEPLWQEAEVKVFATVGVPLTIEMTTQTTGLRIDEVVAYWHKQYPWSAPAQHEVALQIEQEVIRLVKEKGVAMRGVNEVIAVCEAAKMPMAIASSSSKELIEAVTKKLGIDTKIRVVHSAHDEEYGKPHPAVYIRAAAALGVEPSHCLAFEDSANGLLAAKAAKMRCIAVPDLQHRDDKRFGIADRVLASLDDFTPSMLLD